MKHLANFNCGQCYSISVNFSFRNLMKKNNLISFKVLKIVKYIQSGFDYE
jgi:hypothetical protein